jgi:hypothetical protein
LLKSFEAVVRKLEREEEEDCLNKGSKEEVQRRR